ncbi:MAG: NmrA family NAD(P)-binding protein [Nitrospira sp.]
MSVLVIGGTGMIGRHVVQGLVAKGEPVQVLTRSADRVDALPCEARGIMGDLRKPETLRGAMKGVDRVFLVTSLSPTETEEGLAAVAASNYVGVRHLVYLSAHHAERTPHIPHFKSKAEIHKALRDSGMPFTLIMANNLFQNDLAYRESILEKGIYPQPIGGIGLNRVDVRDVADAAVVALTQTGHEFRCYPLIGVERLGGHDVADIYSLFLGREIHYGGNDLETWENTTGRTLPGWKTYNLKLMYEVYQRYELLASDKDFVLQEQVLDHLPRSFHTFVRETVMAWEQERPYGQTAMRQGEEERLVIG